MSCDVSSNCQAPHFFSDRDLASGGKGGGAEYAIELGSIQGDFAWRADLLYQQYRKLAKEGVLPPGEQYDATLAICIVQALLTNCTELLKTEYEANREVHRYPPLRLGVVGSGSDLAEELAVRDGGPVALALEALLSVLSGLLRAAWLGPPRTSPCGAADLDPASPDHVFPGLNDRAPSRQIRSHRRLGVSDQARCSGARPVTK